MLSFRDGLSLAIAEMAGIGESALSADSVALRLSSFSSSALADSTSRVSRFNISFLASSRVVEKTRFCRSWSLTAFWEHVLQ